MRLIDADTLFKIAYEHMDDAALAGLKNALERVPTAEPSVVTMRLDVDKESFRKAMEEAKLTLVAEPRTIIKCDECKYWDTEWIPAIGEGHYCPMMDHVMVGDEWCCYAERRNDG